MVRLVIWSIPFLLFTSLLYFWPPDFEKLRKSVEVTRWRDGKPIAKDTVGPQTKNWVPLRSISKYLQNAVLSSEDAAFYTHQGLDLFELQESIKKDLEKGKFARGGSTITQQLIKNVYLSPHKNLFRKVREMIWAIQIEKKLSKIEILSFYLNLVEWGPGVYGIADASNHFFSKRPLDLTPIESAYLAMLLPSPIKYYEYYRKKTLTPWAQGRILHILHVMQKMGFLTSSEYEDTIRQGLWGISLSKGDEEKGEVKEDPDLQKQEALESPTTPEPESEVPYED